LLIVGLLSALLLALNWYRSPDNFPKPIDLVQAVAALLAGTVGLLGLFFTWRNLNQTRKTTEDQLRVAREGQNTDRFTRAIEQLGATDDKGDKRLGIRLGGIYALERITTDSPERYYSTVMEVLMAYIRENTRLDSKNDANRSQENSTDSEPTESVSQSSLLDRPKAPADIQRILDVLTRLKRLEEKGLPNEQHMLIDLKESNLSGVNLSEADLFRANLSDAILFRADLSKAKLSEANLFRANLLRAFLFRAKLPRAFLFRANLSGAFLTEADLSGAFLTEADLSDAILFRADLSGADLSEANFAAANLSGANLIGAMHLDQAQLEQARGDATTRLPSDFEWPKSWIKGEHEATSQNEQS
jgi:uncharacterized protein YjbI with pentapeptide repeats